MFIGALNQTFKNNDDPSCGYSDYIYIYMYIGVSQTNVYTFYKIVIFFVNFFLTCFF